MDEDKYWYRFTCLLNTGKETSVFLAVSEKNEKRAKRIMSKKLGSEKIKTIEYMGEL